MPRMSQRSALVQPTTAETHAVTQSRGFDIKNPQHMAAAVTRLTNWGLQSTPSERREGAGWYPMAHDIVQGARGSLSMAAASGVTSILSPGSEWSGRNVPAISESVGLQPSHWKMIADTHASAVKDLQARRARGEADRYEKAQRHPEVAAMLSEHAPNLGGSSDVQLLKAHSVLQGADPEQVIPRLTSPKTNAFYHGILDPRHGGGQVPIDYRMADLVANKMQSYKTKRDIYRGSYAKASSGETGYELHEQVIGHVGQMLHERGGRAFSKVSEPLHAQAFLWHMGKQFELSHPEAKQSQQRPGEAFTGPPRTGQPYMSSSGGRL